MRSLLDTLAPSVVDVASRIDYDSATPAPAAAAHDLAAAAGGTNRKESG